MAGSSASSKDVYNLLKIERLCSTISNTLFVMSDAPSSGSDDRHLLELSSLAQDLSHLELEFASQNSSSKPRVYDFFVHTNCFKSFIPLPPLYSTAPASAYPTPSTYVSELH